MEPSLAPIIRWERVSKRYPGAQVDALDDVTINVGAGEIVVLVGPNGSGKTTLMEMAAGLRLPSKGSVSVLGRAVQPSGPQRLILGVQLQNSSLPSRIRVKEAMRATQALYADPVDVNELLTQLGLKEYANAAVESLSGGWQRRLDVALACVGKPRVLVLDEPTSGIDPVARSEMWEFLRKRRSEGTGVLASTHDLTEAESYADRLLVLNRGRLVLQGTVDEVLGLAGGGWRLRVLGTDSRFDHWAQDIGSAFLSAGGDSRVHIGSRESVTYLSQKLEDAKEDGTITYLDALRGPVRLEDVFAFAVEHADSQEFSR